MLTYTRTVGEVFSLPLAFTDDTGSAIDLTGGTVYFTAKNHLDESDATALIDEKVTSHDNAAGGLSSIPIDLTNVAAGEYKADIWFKDSAGNPQAYPVFILEIVKGATKSTTD